MSFTFILTFVLLSIVLIVLLTSTFKQNTFLSMLLVSMMLAILILPAEDIIPVITHGFGDTMKSIGIIIILGIMIGVILEKTGATTSMANAILKLTGKNKAGMAIGLTGFIVGIPIFANSGFIVLNGLNKSLVKSTGKPMIYMACMLAAGLYTVHCLIPPHPGAMAAAAIVKPNIGNLIMIGLLIALPASLAGFAWVKFMTRNEKMDVSESEYSLEKTIDERILPSTFWSFMPVIVPLVLLTGKSIVSLYQPASSGLLLKIISFVGYPEVALLIGVFLSLGLFKKINKSAVNELFDEAIEKAGPILVLTAAGGIFGSVIKSTGVGGQAGDYLATTGLGLLIPFVIAAFLKTAQGSSTVAIITAASIVAPMLTALNLDSEAGKMLATLAMGAGSMIVSHANDSFFWVVAKFSGLDNNSTLRVYSSSTFIMGSAAFICIWIASLIML